MSRCNHRSLESCLRADECAQCLREKGSGSFAGPTGYSLRSLEEFAQLLMKHRLMDECAWFDPEGYDGGATLERLSRAFHEATDNAKLRDDDEQPARGPEL